MSICGTCGRQHNGDERFCGGCGAKLADAPAGLDGATAESATRIDGPSTPSDTFASWYQPPGGLHESTAEQHQPTQTVLPAGGYQPPPAGYPGPQPGYPGPQPGYPGPQPGYPGPPFTPGPPAGGPQRSGPRGLLVLVAVIVVLAAGGGAYALATTLGKHQAAPPSAGGSSGPATSPASSPPSPTPSPTLSLVAIGSGAGNVSPSVEELLSHYFHGINFRDYAEYASTLTAANRAGQPQSTFAAGYQTTTDSGMTITSMAATSGTAGGLTATVTFTSRQSPQQSVDHSACNTWTLNLYLVPQGAGYLIGPAPSGYKPDHSDC